MKNIPENITIKQIAELAGVSAGTVDRVLHGRGKVSGKNLEKINKILKKVDYQPNIIASALASQKKYRIAAVIPEFKAGEYWETVSLGMDAAVSEFKQFGVQMEKVFFDQYNSATIENVVGTLTSGDLDGVILAVLFKEKFTELSAQLTERNIPFVYMDFNLANENQLSFYGTDSVSGGMLSARMMLSLINKNDDILIVLLNSASGKRSNQSLNREKGFLEYLEKKNFTGNIHRINLESVDSKKNEQMLDDFFSEKNVKGVIVFNSTCHLVAKYFKDSNRQDTILVGYDGIEENINMLKEGFVDVLIAQRPYYQGYESTKSLCNFLLKKIIPPKENYIPLDVVVSENVNFYNLQ